MVKYSNPCKELIDLAGSLDFRFRNGKPVSEIKPVIKRMRSILTQVENILEQPE